MYIHMFSIHTILAILLPFAQENIAFHPIVSNTKCVAWENTTLHYGPVSACCLSGHHLFVFSTVCHGAQHPWTIILKNSCSHTSTKWSCKQPPSSVLLLTYTQHKLVSNTSLSRLNKCVDSQSCKSLWYLFKVFCCQWLATNCFCPILHCCQWRCLWCLIWWYMTISCFF